MSGPPRAKSMNCADSESRPVLGPAGNKARSIETHKTVLKPLSQRKVEKWKEIDEAKAKKAPSLPVASPTPSPPHCIPVPSILRQQGHKVLKSNLSPNASCSSDASSESTRSGASTGKTSRRRVALIRRKPCPSKPDKVVSDTNFVSAALEDASLVKKRCAWMTSNSDPCYVAFHDKEWGSPVHDDRELFELLILSTALAELTWPAILNRRHMFREVFLDFDLIAMSKLNERKILTPGSPATSLLSEVKLRSIIENARQMCKITKEYGSFNNYIWGFVNHKPIVGQFRYPHQVPIKTSKADAISKDLVRRGFRGVGPTVIHTFMQVAGLTNDHLISCFRFQECIAAADAWNGDENLDANADKRQPENTAQLGLARAIDDLSLLSE